MQYIGMDIHATTTTISWVDEANAVMRPFAIPTTEEALRGFAQAFPRPARVAIEATRNHAFVHDLLEAEGLSVLVSHPRHTEAITSCKRKSDRHDAMTLARLLKAELLTASYVPPLQIRLLRELVREHIRLTAICTRARNWIRASLAQHGLRCRFTDLMGPGAQAWLTAAPLHPTRRAMVERSIQIIAFVLDRIKEVRSDIIARVKSDPRMKLLISIPGMGYLLAAAILAEIGEISRFASDRRLASYAGLVTTTRESAGIIRHGHITKEGSVVLRWALGMTVTHLIRKPGPLKHFYQRAADKHGKKSARAATARKLTRYVFAMLTQQTMYDPTLSARRRQECLLGVAPTCIGQAR
jgi:transposase